MSEKYSKSVKHDSKCVCEICTCGGHKCPSTVNKYAPELLRTTFQKDYTKHPLSISQPFKQTQSVKQYRYPPDMVRSQYQSEYLPHRVQPERHAKKEVEGSSATNLPFAKGSEYTHNYKEFNSIRTQPFTPQAASKKDLQIPFHAVSTYKSDFNKWRQPQFENIRVKNTGDLSLANNAKFLSDSVYKSDFQRFKTEQQPRPQSTTQQPYIARPFDGISEYKTRFGGFDPRIYDNVVCPVEQLPARPPQLQPGHSHLTYSHKKMMWQ